MEIDQIFEKFSNMKVLIVGDLMVDRYLFGNITRVSPEAPVPVVAWRAEENRLGGAANVALNIEALGATPFLCGVVGQDKESESFFDLMQQFNLDSSLVVQIKDRPTTIKTRIIANDQHLLRLDREIADDISNEEAEGLIQIVENFLKTHEIDVLIFQDYNKGVLNTKVINGLLKLAESRRIPVAVDPKFRSFWEYKNVQLFKPNLKEVQDVLPFAITPTIEPLQQAANFIKKNLNNGLLLITLSENGVFISNQNNSVIYPTTKRQVADVCGAGDAVIAIASLALTIGLNDNEIAWLANMAGGQVVENVGVVAINLEQLKAEMKRERLTLGK